MTEVGGGGGITEGSLGGDRYCLGDGDERGCIISEPDDGAEPGGVGTFVIFAKAASRARKSFSALRCSRLDLAVLRLLTVFDLFFGLIIGYIVSGVFIY